MVFKSAVQVNREFGNAFLVFIYGIDVPKVSAVNLCAYYLTKRVFYNSMGFFWCTG